MKGTVTGIAVFTVIIIVVMLAMPIRQLPTHSLVVLGMLTGFFAASMADVVARIAQMTKKRGNSRGE